MIKNITHGFHLVNPRPWPFINSLNTFSIFSSIILLMNKKILVNLTTRLIILLFRLYFWWKDVHRESSYQGFHTSIIIKIIIRGIILFIISEIFFFFSFFWESLYYILVLDIEFSMIWPPKGVKFFDIITVPLLNTFILLRSGVRATYSHFLLINKDYNYSIIYLIITIFLGLYFTFLQWIEYKESFFTMSDSIFGSTFYLITGFHGIHVIVGTLFLIVSLIRFIKFSTISSHNLNFEIALWYWHFVDVVWIFLYLILYIWSN